MNEADIRKDERTKVLDELLSDVNEQLVRAIEYEVAGHSDRKQLCYHFISKIEKFRQAGEP